MPWCDPENLNCPLHPDNDQHLLFCGQRDEPYIQFLKMVRSRVATWTLVTERQNFNFRHLQESTNIDVKSLDMLKQAFRVYQHSQVIANGGKRCEAKATSALPETDKQFCTKCAVHTDECKGDPRGNGVKDKDWCHKNCIVVETDPRSEADLIYDKALKDEVQKALSEQSLAVLKGKLKVVCGTLSLSLSFR